MNNDDIKADRAIIDAATEGPWHSGDAVRPTVFLYATPASQVDANWRHDALMLGEVYADGGGHGRRNLKFIAAARTRWPAALDEIGRLRDAVASLENEVENLRADARVFQGQHNHALKQYEEHIQKHDKDRQKFWEVIDECRDLKIERDNYTQKYQETATALAEMIVECDSKIDQLYYQLENSDAFKLKIEDIDHIRELADATWSTRYRELEDAYADAVARRGEALAKVGALQDTHANAARERDQLQSTLEEMERRYLDMMTKNATLEAEVENLGRLTEERDEWRRRAEAHGCDTEKGDIDCG